MRLDPAALDGCDSLYVSPHGDDVLLSCAARLLSELEQGLRVTVVTVFGAGGGRRHAAAEAAFDRLGVRRVALGLPEASGRQASYAAFEALTAQSHPDDDRFAAAAAEALADLGHRS